MNKNLPRIIISIVILAGIGIFSLINSGSDNVLNYNDKIVDLLTAMDNSFTNYVSEFDKYYERKAVDVELLDREANKIKEVTDRTKNDVLNINVPDYDICREFHRVALNYIENRIDFYEVYFELNEYIKIYSPSEMHDLQYVDNKLDPRYIERDIIIDELIVVQERMADQFDFEFE